MATSQEKTVHQLKQSLTRLATQEGTAFTLSIDQMVTPRGGKNPLRRDQVDKKETVDLEALSLVSIVESETHGMCVRLVFGQQLYATCGEYADKIIKWATACVEATIREKITNFPEVHFQKVVGNIQIRGEELALA